MSSVKRKCFSIEVKSAILRRLEAGETNANLAKEFRVPHSTISTIKKDKQKIETLFKANVLKRKRVRASTQDQVDKALLQWVKLECKQEVPIKAPLLQERANIFARELNIPNFNCSKSWISRFRVRHNISELVRSNADCMITSNFNDLEEDPLSIRTNTIDNQLPIKNESPASIDNAVIKCEEPFNEDIMEITITNDRQIKQNNDDGDKETISSPSAFDALKAAELLKTFIQTNFDNENINSMMSQIHDAVRSFYNQTKQTKITDFFQHQ